MEELSDTDRQAVEEAFQELEEAVRHLDAMTECTSLFGRVKQELETGGRLPQETQEAFVDRIVALYVRARTAREETETALPAMDGAEQDAARQKADAYHRDTAALLNAISMLCFVEPKADRGALMDRLETAYAKQGD